MTSNTYSPKLKYYHVILISILLCPLLIINSNYLNKKREQEKALKQDIKILRQLYARKLDSSSDDDSFTSDTNKICEKGTKDLQNYYKTGDGSIIGIKEDEEIKSENNPKYIDALVNLISREGSSGDNIKDYIMHLIPVLFFFVVAILFLPGWLVCCICSCCKCYCCCCCQKPVCKLPFYIITMLIYALGICVSIYGLSKSNTIFEGLADTECSLLKFIGEVLNGETKEKTPKWGGIYNILNIFEETKENLNGLTDETKENLDNSKSSTTSKQDDFETALETYSKHISNDDNTGEGYYKKALTISNGKGGDYYLDIIKNFGTFTKASKTVTSNSFVENWYNEYKEMSKKSEEQMDESTTKFDELKGQKDEAIGGMESGISSLGDIKTTFDDVKGKLADKILDYSDLIEKYGKLSSTIVFSVLMAINAVTATIITLKLFTSFLSSGNSCIKCLLSSIVHILWNISGLLTFLTLIIGSAFYGIGTIGKDLVSVVSFLVSDKNLDKGEDAILLGSSAKYLKKCINGDGNLKSELDFNEESLNKLDFLKTAKIEIENLMEQANELLNTKFAYKAYLEQYKERKLYKNADFKLIKSDSSNTLTFSDYLSNLNNDISSRKEIWSITCDSNEHSCNSIPISTHTDEYCIKPSTCTSQNADDWYTSASGTFKENVDIVSAFIDSINIASKTTTINLNSDTLTSTKSIDNVLIILDDRYTKFLKSQTESLGVYNNTIARFTDIFSKFSGDDGDIFSIINGKFIGRNVKVILKYLEKSLGNNFSSVGISLITVGLSMCISIPFTILLNLIIDSKNTPNVDGIQELNPQNADTPFDTNLNANVNNENVDNNVEVEVGKVIEFNNNA